MSTTKVVLTSLSAAMDGGPGGAAVGTLTERLQDDAAARLRTRLRALLSEVAGRRESEVDHGE